MGSFDIRNIINQTTDLTGLFNTFNNEPKEDTESSGKISFIESVLNKLNDNIKSKFDLNEALYFNQNNIQSNNTQSNNTQTVTAGSAINIGSKETVESNGLIHVDISKSSYRPSMNLPVGTWDPEVAWKDHPEWIYKGGPKYGVSEEFLDSKSFAENSGKRLTQAKKGCGEHWATGAYGIVYDYTSNPTKGVLIKDGEKISEEQAINRLRAYYYRASVEWRKALDANGIKYNLKQIDALCSLAGGGSKWHAPKGSGAQGIINAWKSGGPQAVKKYILSQIPMYKGNARQRHEIVDLITGENEEHHYDYRGYYSKLNVARSEYKYDKAVAHLYGGSFKFLYTLLGEE